MQIWQSYFLFPIWMPFISSSCLITVVRTSTTILNKTGKSRWSYCTFHLFCHQLGSFTLFLPILPKYCNLLWLQVIFTLSHSHVLVKEILMFANDVLILFLPFRFIVLSYFHIAMAVLKIHSVEVRLNAFSNFSSHLIVFIIYYVTGIFVYMCPHS